MSLEYYHKLIDEGEIFPSAVSKLISLYLPHPCSSEVKQKTPCSMKKTYEEFRHVSICTLSFESIRGASEPFVSICLTEKMSRQDKGIERAVDCFHLDRHVSYSACGWCGQWHHPSERCVIPH